MGWGSHGCVVGRSCSWRYSLLCAKIFFLFYLRLTCIMFVNYFLSLLSFFELFLSFFFFLSFSFLTMYICVPFSSLSWPLRAWPKGGGTVMTHDRVTVTCHTFVTF